MLKDTRKRFEFIRTAAHGLKRIDLWWKFVNGDDKVLEEIEEYRQRTNLPGEKLV